MNKPGRRLLKCLVFPAMFVCVLAAASGQINPTDNAKPDTKLHSNLTTADTTVELVAGDALPRLAELAGRGQTAWHNRAEESLASYVD
jgi:hypothetical protein